MSVFTEARRRYDAVIESGLSETVARLVHSVTLGANPATMLDGAVSDGRMTRAQADAYYALVRTFIEDDEAKDKGAFVLIDRVHNRPADIYTPPEDTIKIPMPSADARKGPFEQCHDESCDTKPDVRMSLGGVEVFLCARHARLLVATR